MPVWSDVIDSQKRWTEQVCRYLDDWDPEPADMCSRRAAAFDSLLDLLRRYTHEHGETVRTVFRQALYLDIHRRFVHSHGRDSADGPEDLYGRCKRDPALSSAVWAGEPLEPTLERRIDEFETDVARPDPDPDVMRANGTSDLNALVALEDKRRAVVRALELDDAP